MPNKRNPTISYSVIHTLQEATSHSIPYLITDETSCNLRVGISSGPGDQEPGTQGPAGV